MQRSKTSVLRAIVVVLTHGVRRVPTDEGDAHARCGRRGALQERKSAQRGAATRGWLSCIMLFSN